MTKTRKRRVSTSKKTKSRKIKRSKKSTNENDEVNKDYSTLFSSTNLSGNDFEAKLRDRILKKKAQSELESEAVKSSSSDDPSDTSAKSSSAKSSSIASSGNKEATNSFDRRASLATSNHNPSDGDDEESEKNSVSSGSMGSNRSQLSSKEEPKFDPEEVAAYDDIENQLIADQSKEIEYLNGIDEPINKADLPVLVKEENRNGPYMNEPMKLRISRLKRTKIWVRALTSPDEIVINDEVDLAIAAAKEAEANEKNAATISEDEVGVAIFDNPSQDFAKKTLDMENKLKNAILDRLQKKL
ncbi:unnamed protein product [Oikopleura dioica]|uniref:Uncharacterized protein n=1 Tax=Oikopleura dioica TaxID=34765 RepID=E4X7B7_OIKDI|nr:unnamed protein product [Oikopleura dioica]CBY34673.1 unnamed protein product [Oikopleura dioica]